MEWSLAPFRAPSTGYFFGGYPFLDTRTWWVFSKSAWGCSYSYNLDIYIYIYINHSSRGYIPIYGGCSHYTHVQPQFHPKSTAMAPTSSRHWSKWTPAQRSQHQIGRCRRCWCVGRPKWCKHLWRNHRLKSFRRTWDMFEGKNPKRGELWNQIRCVYHGILSKIEIETIWIRDMYSWAIGSRWPEDFGTFNVFESRDQPFCES